MTKMNLVGTAIAALLLSASLASANGGKNNGGGNAYAGADATAIALASASNSNSNTNTVNVEGSAMAPGISGAMCNQGAGIGIVGFSIGGGSPKMKCIAAITAAEMLRAGALTPNQARDAWLIAVGMKLEDSDSASTAGSASTASTKGIPNFVGEWNSLTKGQKRAVIGCDATLNNKRTAECVN